MSIVDWKNIVLSFNSPKTAHALTADWKTERKMKDGRTYCLVCRISESELNYESEDDLGQQGCMYCVVKSKSCRVIRETAHGTKNVW
jgi:hypothetical protein